MRKTRLGVAVIASLLAGCGNGEDTFGPNTRAQGRYAGIGTFEAGRMWSQTAGITEPADAAAARLADDEHVIVVIDTHTGEVRQCGDHSGVCVAMNPWTGAGGLTAPVALKKHATELDPEEQASEANGSEANASSAH
jgi:hypothetical protein